MLSYDLMLIIFHIRSPAEITLPSSSLLSFDFDTLCSNLSSDLFDHKRETVRNILALTQSMTGMLCKRLTYSVEHEEASFVIR